LVSVYRYGRKHGGLDEIGRACAVGERKGKMPGTKTVQMRYSTAWMDIQVPERATVLQYGTPEFPEIPVHPNPQKAVREALRNPIGAEPLSEVVRPGDRIAIAFDDGFKKAEANKYVIPIVIETLGTAGVSEEDIELIAAVGGHRKCLPSELRDELLGRELYHRFCPFDGGASRIRSHDCTEGNVYLGESDYGDLVEYDRVVKEADLVIYAGSIKPLGFGGYSGQGVAIGLAGARSLDSLHSHSVYKTQEVLNGECDPAKNIYRAHKLAVHRRIEQAIGKRIFYVDTLMGPGHQTVSAYAGYVPELEQREYPDADELFLVDVPQFDIVVSGVPYDLSYDTSDNPGTLGVYSQVLRMARNKPLLREGGVLISLAQCRGIISKHRPADHEALQLFRECFDLKEFFEHSDYFWNHPEYLRAYKYHYAFSPKHSIFMCGDAAHHWKLTRKSIVAGDVVPGLIREHGLTPAPDFDTAFRIALDTVGKRNPDILVLPRFHDDPRPVFNVQ
jgi:nickel-dependent lactate racemase